jgi:hypothetical protein
MSEAQDYTLARDPHSVRPGTASGRGQGRSLSGLLLNFTRLRGLRVGPSPVTSSLQPEETELEIKKREGRRLDTEDRP